MFTYQVRPRVFHIDSGPPFEFPSEGEVRFHFAPLQPFGVEAGGGRTAVKAVAASVLFNANTGAHAIESKVPLQPLDVTLEEPSRIVKMAGNVLSVSQLFASNSELTQIVEGIYFGLPLLLSVEFADPTIIERVEGTIGGVSFRWQLQAWDAQFKITTQEHQEVAVSSSWEKMGLLSAPENRRLLAALHYFHVAVRLSRQGTIAGEFLAEMILNLSKVLEVLFPPSGDGLTRNAARRGLSSLGFSETEIEADYMPAMALRNEIDVGHVDLGIFKLEQLALIHGYVSHAEEAYRTLLRRVIAAVETGEFSVEAYELGSTKPEVAAIVKRLKQHANRYML
jgi:hypothetical protein